MRERKCGNNQKMVITGRRGVEEKKEKGVGNAKKEMRV